MVFQLFLELYEWNTRSNCASASSLVLTAFVGDNLNWNRTKWAPRKWENKFQETNEWMNVQHRSAIA